MKLIDKLTTRKQLVYHNDNSQHRFNIPYNNSQIKSLKVK